MINKLAKKSASRSTRLGLLAIAMCFFAVSATAVDQVVTSNTDTLTPGTLRQAITDINAGAGGDTITFNLSAGNETIIIASQLPDITKPMTINGANSAPGSGTAITVKVPTPGTSGWQVFKINALSETINIQNMTIKGGSVAFGGGIFVFAGTLNLTNCIVSGSKATIFGGGIANAGTMTITNSTISGNTAFSSGGGIYNEHGTMTITNSTVSDNTPGPEEGCTGGGIYNNDGTVTITNSTVSGNTAASYGGGICNNAGTVTITNSTVSGNTAATTGGGIYNNGTMTITNSTVSGNTAVNGGGIFFDSPVTILNSTVSGNTATTESGGGIYNNATAYLLNTIVINNTATTSGGDIYTETGKTTYAYYCWYNLIGGTGTISTQPGTAPNKTTAYESSLGALQVNAPGTTATMAVVSGTAYQNGTFAYYNATDGYYLQGSDNNYYKVVGYTTPSDPHPVTDKISTDQRGVTRSSPATIGAYSFTPYYMAKVSGDWSAYATVWFTSETIGGSYTTQATESPTASTSAGIIINDDITVTISSADVTIDQTTVNTGGHIIVNSGRTLTIADGTDTDLTVAGTGDIDVNGTIDATGATITYSGAGTLEITGTATSLGTFTPGSSTVTYDGAAQAVAALTYYNLTLSGSDVKTVTTGNIVVGGNLATSQALTLSAGSLAVTGTSSIGANITTSSTQTYTGQVTLTGDGTTKTLTTTDSTIAFNGGVTDGASSVGLSVNAGSANVTLGGALDIGRPLTKYGAGNFVTGGNAITTGNLTVSDGTFNSDNSAGTWDINGQVWIVASGILNATSGTFTVSGAWRHQGVTFNNNSGTVVFDGAGTSTISGTNTFNHFTCATPGKTLTFTTGVTQTISGMFTLTGTSGDGNLITVNSSSSGTKADINVSSSNVSYVTVKDSNNTGTLINPSNSTNGGNTTRWFPATKLAIQAQPVGGASGAVLATQPIIEIQDSEGNVITTDSTTVVTVAIKSGAGGTLGGTLTATASSGVATFAGVTLAGKVLTDYTLEFTATALASVTSGNVRVTVGTAAKLAFTTPPSASTAAGVAFAQQPVVTIQDAQGNTVTTATDSVELTLTTGTGTLGGTATMTATSGVADFAGKGLNINLPGADKVLTATSGSLAVATTAPPFTITSTNATITSETYTVTILGTNGTISAVPFNTSKASFLSLLAKGQSDQTWNDSGIANTVVSGNTLVVTAQDGTTQITYTVINVAKFHKLTTVNGSGSGSYTDGTAVAITANTPDAGKMFSAWTGDTASVANVNIAATTVSMPASDITVTATYVDIPSGSFTLTVNNGTGSGSYSAGTIVAIAANPATTGMIFDQWIGDVTTVANVYATTTAITIHTTDVQVTATYKIPGIFTVTFQTDGTAGASITGTATQSVTEKANCTPVGALAPANWAFVKWTASGSLYSTSNPLRVRGVTGDMTLTANFSPVLDPSTLTVVANPAEGGSASPASPLEVKFGELANIAATPADG